MSYTVGQAFLQIVPSFAGVVDAIEAEMEKDGEIAGNVFQEAFEEATRGLSVRVGADTSDASTKIAAIDAQLHELQDQRASIQVGVQDDEAEAKIAAIDAQIAALAQQSASIKVGIDEADALTKIAVLKADSDELGAKSPTIRVNVDAGEAVTELGAVKVAADGASGSGGSGGIAGLNAAASEAGSVGLPSLMTAALPVAPALIAVGAAGVGAIGGIAAAAVAGAVGLGAFAAAASGDLGQVESAAKSAFDTWRASEQSIIQPAVDQWISGIAPLIDSLSPIVASVTTSVQQLGVSFDGLGSSPGWTKFVNWVAAEAPSSIGALTDLLGGVASGFASMGEAGSPVISMLDSGLRSLGTDIANFGQSSTFKDFVSWLQKNLPTIGHDLVTISDDVGHLAASLAPLGVDMIHTIADISNAIRTVVQDTTGWAHSVNDFVSGVLGEATSMQQFNQEVDQLHKKSQGQIADLAAVLVGTKNLTQAQLDAATAGLSLAQIAQAHTLALQQEAVAVVATRDQFYDLAGVGAAATAQTLAMSEAAKTASDSLSLKLSNSLEGATSDSLAMSDTAKATSAGIDLVSASAERASQMYLVNAGATVAMSNAAKSATADGPPLANTLLGTTASALTGSEAAKGMSTDLESLGTRMDTTQKQADGLNVSLKTLGADQVAAGKATASSFDSATSILSAFSGQVTVTRANITNFYAQAVTGAAQFSANIQTAIKDGYNPALIAQLLEAGPTQAGPILQSLVANASTSFTAMVNSSTSALSAITNQAVEEARLMQVAIHATNSSVTADYSTAMSIDQTIMAQGSTATVATVAAALGLLPAQVEAIMLQYGIKLSTGITNSGPPAVAATSVIAANIILALQGMNAAGMTAGEQLDLGIAAGIASQGGTAATAAASMVAKTISAAKSQAGITSPSRVFADEVGVPIAQGLALGITAGAGSVVDAAEAVISSALVAMTGRLGGSVSVAARSPSPSPSPAMSTTALSALAVAPRAAAAVVSSFPALPVPGPSASLSYGDIHINAPSGSAQDIAAAVEAVLQRNVESAQLALTARGRR